MRLTVTVVVVVAALLPIRALGQQSASNGAVARCGNGQYVFVGTGADTCVGYGGVAEWFDAAEKARAARDVEPKRLRDEAERKRTAAESAKAAATRARAAAEWAKADAERKRKEAEPLVRVSEAQARAILADATFHAKNDVNVFSASFFAAVARIAPEFRGPQVVSQTDALTILVSGPLGYLFADARERVRKFEPLIPPPAWSTGIHIVVQPKQIDAPDIEKVVVQRNGSIVLPLRMALGVSEMATRMGAKRMIHGGEVTYPLSAFDPGAGVTVTIIAIPASGSNITRTFGSLELRAIQ